ncbi:unnamed protein product [Linum trigynum]|uniref:Uncharacterized protein n=1 Tax=Linum trigynum TaxID=586398 RepID=A0AAV2D320_9ROSI
MSSHLPLQPTFSPESGFGGLQLLRRDAEGETVADQATTAGSRFASIREKRKIDSTPATREEEDRFVAGMFSSSRQKPHHSLKSESAVGF